MMGLPVPMFMHTQPLLSAFVLLALTVPILILNRSYFTVGFSRLFKGAPNMDSLVALGAAAGLVYSLIEMGLLAAGKVTGMPDLYFESAGMILALVTVGKYLEERSKGKTTGAITALLALAPRLTADQRNEVAVELCRGLELGQQEFTKYIPDYLGRFALWLPPAELDEVLDDLRVNLSSSDSRVTASVLDTVGVIYEAYDAYRSRFPETDDAYRRRRERLLGLLMRGLSGIDGATRQEALFVLGRRVFGSGELGRHEKRRAFMLTQRKLLSAQDEFPGEGLTFYYRAAMLGKLYRFITEERLFHKGFDFGAPRPLSLIHI